MAANETDGAIQKYVKLPEQIVAPSEHSTDPTSQIVEILDDGSQVQLKRAELTEEQKKRLFLILLLVLLAQASCFSAFQILNILLRVMHGSASEKEQIIAVWSAFSLLTIAAVTVGGETAIRAINWWFSSEAKELQKNRLSLLIDLLKIITVSLFCASFYFEQVKTFNPALALEGAVFFVVLILFDALVDGVISAFTPSEHYMSTGLFLASCLKLVIFVAALMQLFSETAVAGFSIAALCFALIAGDVVLLGMNDRADVANAHLQSTLLQLANIQDQVSVIVDRVSNDSNGPQAPLLPSTRLSHHPLTFFQRISRYLCAEGSFPAPQPQGSTLKK